MPEVVIIGAGAAGMFLAANWHADCKVTVLEQSATALQKLKISGGGRCNLTNATYEVASLITNYPRGAKELQGVFYRFQPRDTMAWFEQRGVPLKVEPDGRVFPCSDSSQSIINCLLHQTAAKGVQIHYNSRVMAVEKQADGFAVYCKHKTYRAAKVVVCCGANGKVWDWLGQLGLEIVPPVASLFTFKCHHHLLQGLAGISFPAAQLRIKGTKFSQKAPLLITHWGLSGPAVLKLSAYAARYLFSLGYKFELEINWLGLTSEQVVEKLTECRRRSGSRKLINLRVFEVSKRFWQQLLTQLKLADITVANLTNKDIRALAAALTAAQLSINGKSTFKEEFVTAGGVELSQVDFRTMQCRQIPGLYLAGEILDIDGITGGFNFQACWSQAYVIAQAMAAV